MSNFPANQKSTSPAGKSASVVKERIVFLSKISCKSGGVSIGTAQNIKNPPLSKRGARGDFRMVEQGAKFCVFSRHFKSPSIPLFLRGMLNGFYKTSCKSGGVYVGTAQNIKNPPLSKRGARGDFRLAGQGAKFGVFSGHFKSPSIPLFLRGRLNSFYKTSCKSGGVCFV